MIPVLSFKILALYSGVKSSTKTVCFSGTIYYFVSGDPINAIVLPSLIFNVDKLTSSFIIDPLKHIFCLSIGT